MSLRDRLEQPSNLTVRVLAGLAMIAVALAAIDLGGIFFWLLAAVVGLFMMAEWANLQGVSPQTKRMTQYALTVPLAIMAPIAAGPNFFALGLLAAAFFFVGVVTRRGALAFGILYVGLPIFALLVIRHQDNGLVYAIWALALVWATDIGAYFAGRAIGGPKLAPAISPAKTWAGLVGGVLLATLFAWGMNLAYALPLRLLIATPFLAVLAQVGDLYESWLKRRAGVKDSGDLIPGHGGFLDRLDGVVPTAPVAALVLMVPFLFA